MLLEEKSRLEKRKELVGVFYLEKGFKSFRCFMHLPRKKIVLNKKDAKEKKTSKGDYLNLSLMLSYND